MSAIVSGMRRRWAKGALVALAVVLVGLVAYGLLDSPTRIYYYRVLDERTLAVGTVSGPGARVRVTDVAETPSTVTITVRSLFIQLGPGTDEGIDYESMAKLREPLGGRTVIDASNGLPVERGNCPPPAVFAPVCPASALGPLSQSSPAARATLSSSRLYPGTVAGSLVSSGRGFRRRLADRI